MLVRQSGTFFGQAHVIACAVALSCLLGGCGLSSITSGLGSSVLGGGSSAQPEVKAVNAEQLLTAAKADEGAAAGAAPVGDVAHGCPRFLVWPRDNNLTVYEQGRVGDSLAVMHRGEIIKTARECQVEGNRVTVKYGFSGRVLMGPRGKPGNVTLPVNVYVTDAKREKIANDKVTVEVPIAVEKPIGYFSTVRSVTFNIPEGARAGEYEVFVGFDRAVPNAG